MKQKLKKIILVFLYILLGNTVYAQHKEDIRLRAFYTGENVLLRWYPRTLEIYQKCAVEGFVVERRQAGAIEGWQEIAVIRKGSFEDISSIEWYEKNAEMLKLVLYKDRVIDQVKQEHPDSISIIEKAYQDMVGQESTFFYAMFMLANEFSVPMSKYAALNYMDETSQTQQLYTYRVRPLNKKLKYSSEEISIETNHKTVLSKMSSVSISRKFEAIKCKWYITQQMKKDYSGYNLERSEDGIHFKKVNDRPIIHIKMSKNDPDTCSFRDTLPQCGKKFIYRVCGVSAFGFTGEPSNVVSEQMMCDYFVRPRFDGIEFNKEGEAIINWHVDNPRNQTIKAFEVQRAEMVHVNAPDTFISISKKLTSKTFKYVDKKPLKSNYYRIAAYGEEGQIGYSNVMYKYPSDTIPPSAPTGLKGIVDSTGLATLTWNPNPEDGILGYRVFISNDSLQPFVCCTDTLLLAPAYTRKLSLSTLNKDVYFKVQAIGGNYGHSEQSEMVRLIKPDIIPPALIAMREIKQNEDNSLMLSWFDSPSDDVNKLEIYRRILPDTTWVLAHVWEGRKSDGTYTDTVSYTGEMVAFRFNIYDESGNCSMTELVPYQTNLLRSNCIRDLQLTADYNRGGIFVEWKKCNCDIKYIRVFRKDDGGKMKLVKTFKSNIDFFLDTKVYVGHEYEYIVHPITETMSEPEREKIKY